MSGQNIVPFDPSRRAPSTSLEDGAVVMLVVVGYLTLMFVGLASGFMLTRAAAGASWPPAGQPWFPPREMAVATVALLASGALVLMSARAWERREARIGPLLLAGVALGVCFLFFRGVVWATLIQQGLSLLPSQHGSFFCLAVALHSLTALVALTFMGVSWVQLKPFRDDEGARGTLSGGLFMAARMLWYFVVAAWPALYLLLYL